MIKSVRLWLNKTVSGNEVQKMRDHSGDVMLHRFHITKARTTNLLFNAIIDPSKNSGKKKHKGQKEQGITEAQAQAAADKAWDEVYTKENIVKNFSKAFNKSPLKTAPRGGIGKESTKNHVVVILHRGAFGRRVGGGSSSSSNSDGTVNSTMSGAAMTSLWDQASKVVYDFLEIKSSGKTLPQKGQRLHGNVEDQGTGAKDEGNVAQTTAANIALMRGGLQSLKTLLGGGSLADVVTKEYVNAFSERYDIKHVQKYTNKKFDDEIIVETYYGSAMDNKDEAIGLADVKGIKKYGDKIAIKITEDLVKRLSLKGEELGLLSGSPSTVTRIQKIVPAVMIQKLFPHKINRPDMRLKVNKQLAKEAKKHKVNRNTTDSIIKAGTAAVLRRTAGKNVSKKKGKKSAGQRAQGKTAQSPIALRNLINEMLPQMVASKMTSPALQFRTGRFANSARVENVNIGSRGGVHVDYTYMKAPYETFEPGGKQGSTQRDPRKIIGASIRELAMGIIGRQPTTIRRN